MLSKNKGLEQLLWSIAIPGFGQLLNHKYIKGLLLIGLEIYINVKSNLNSIIIFSFYSEIDKAVQQAHYNWLLYYTLAASFQSLPFFVNHPITTINQ